MANEFSAASGLRNQLGHPLSNPKLAALQAQLEAKTLGSAAGSQDVAAIGMMAEMEAPEIRAYVTQAVDLVQQYMGNIGELRQVYPLLEEIKRLVQTDPTLSKKQRQHGLAILQKLQQFVGQKVALDTRIASRLKNVARQKVTSWRAAMSEKMQGSKSFLLRQASRPFQGAGPSGPSPVQQDIANAQAGALTTFADNDAAARLANKPQRVASPETRERGFSPQRQPAVSDAELDKRTPPIFKRILNTDLKIYKEVEAVKNTLVEQKELDAAQANALLKAQQRAADNAKKTTSGVKIDEKDEIGEKEGTIGFFGKISNLLSHGISGGIGGLTAGVARAAIAWAPMIAASIGVAVTSYLAGIGIGTLINWMQEQRDRFLLEGRPVPRALTEGALDSFGASLGFPNLSTTLNQRSAGMTSGATPGGAPTAAATGAVVGGDTNYRETMKNVESSGDYSVENPEGYLGAYQLGAMALEDVGELKAGTTKGLSRVQAQAKLSDDSVWTTKGGKAAFLASPARQDAASVKYDRIRETQLRAKKIINKDTPDDVRKGMLAATHLGGVVGVTSPGGMDVPDANGKTPRDYFRMFAPDAAVPTGAVIRGPSPQASLSPTLSAPNFSGMQNAAGADRGRMTVVPIMAGLDFTGRQRPAATTRVFQPLNPDSLDLTIRAIRNTSGSLI